METLPETDKKTILSWIKSCKTKEQIFITWRFYHLYAYHRHKYSDEILSMLKNRREEIEAELRSKWALSIIHYR